MHGLRLETGDLTAGANQLQQGGRHHRVPEHTAEAGVAPDPGNSHFDRAGWERDESVEWRAIRNAQHLLVRIPAKVNAQSGGDEKFFSLSRQARLVALGATQSTSSLRSTLPGEAWRTLLQTFRARIFLTLSDEACGQAERLKEQYSISESSQSGLGLLSGRAGGGKGTYGVTKSYAPRREAVFPPSDFAKLRNAQSTVAAYDGVNPIRPTYCYLKPWYLRRDLPYFQAAENGQL